MQQWQEQEDVKTDVDGCNGCRRRRPISWWCILTPFLATRLRSTAFGLAKVQQSIGGSARPVKSPHVPVVLEWQDWRDQVGSEM